MHVKASQGMQLAGADVWCAIATLLQAFLSSRLHAPLSPQGSHLDGFSVCVGVWLVPASLEPAPRPQAHLVPDQPETARKRRPSDVSLPQPTRPLRPPFHRPGRQALYPWTRGIPDSSACAALCTLD
ncbi:hypothetical protein ACET3X_005296 [Alternaria dauci]|uniref:Uncharacterized protein n=1 Tax=Alternaria dauci TaxID=48095 RepID=A0ABR3UJW3_9PLEO